MEITLLVIALLIAGICIYFKKDIQSIFSTKVLKHKTYKRIKNGKRETVDASTGKVLMAEDIRPIERIITLEKPLVAGGVSYKPWAR